MLPGEKQAKQNPNTSVIITNQARAGSACQQNPEEPRGVLSSLGTLYLGGGGGEQLPPLLAMVLQTPLALMCPAGLPRCWPAQKALPILGPGHWVLALGSLENEKQDVKSLFQVVQAVTLDQEGCKCQGATSLPTSSQDQTELLLASYLLASACTHQTEAERILSIQQELSMFVTVKEPSTY